MKTMLDDLCWFNAVNSLAESEADEAECMDTQMAKQWSQLWDCAGQTLCASIRRPFHHQQHLCPHVRDTGLNSRKREELVFSFRNSNLYQLLVCRHAGGSDSESQFKHKLFAQSTMRVFAIVLFLWSEFKRMHYVYCLCCSMSHRRRAYLYGG
ncbi:hypothetical protein [Klebsiella sp. BIGb0407]|uniref:hypothetical protein n=1 Tax=Klebsiella sp. BIGb0407 TaxID=2940603 RepID=UPI002169DA93|nr:hypothetical protein [Klebsiella sp. BIGb0407]MCS3432490.1 hypothetical protein [Klebsiella sp. BIGb0407]